MMFKNNMSYVVQENSVLLFTIRPFHYNESHLF